MNACVPVFGPNGRPISVALTVVLNKAAASARSVSIPLQGKPASQSSDYANKYVASLAVDGNTNQNLAQGSSCTHTLDQAGAWW